MKRNAMQLVTASLMPLLALVLLTAASCEQKVANEAFVNGLEELANGAKVLLLYERYVNADPDLVIADRGTAIARVGAIRDRLREAKREGKLDPMWADREFNASNLLSDYDRYIDGDPNLGSQSKKIRKGSSAQIRQLIDDAIRKIGG